MKTWYLLPLTNEQREVNEENQHSYSLGFYLYFYCNIIDLELMSLVFIRCKCLSAMNNRILHFTSIYEFQIS